MIHGYDYHFVRIVKEWDRYPHWSKIAALSDHLHNYDMVVSIDADAVFTHLEIPYEWLLNRWGVEPGMSLAMATDPVGDPNFDSKGRVNNNCGFITAQNNERTHEMLRSWANCPDDKQFPGCSSFKNVQMAEQGAFGEYVRRAFTRPTDLKELSCNEANGYPESGSGCNGVFVRHMWTAKHDVRDYLARVYAQFMMSRLHLDFKQRIREIVKVRPASKFYGHLMNQWPGEEPELVPPAANMTAAPTEASAEAPAETPSGPGA